MKMGFCVLRIIALCMVPRACVGVYVCVREFVRVCMYECVRACVRARARVCAFVSACNFPEKGVLSHPILYCPFVHATVCTDLN